MNLAVKVRIKKSFMWLKNRPFFQHIYSFTTGVFSGVCIRSYYTHNQGVYALEYKKMHRV